MTVEQALQQGLLEKLKAAPLCRDGLFRFVTGQSRSQGKEYWAILSEETGAVEVRSLDFPAEDRSVPSLSCAPSLMIRSGAASSPRSLSRV